MKIIKFLKNNFIYILLGIIFLSFFLICINVVPVSDDYSYALYFKDGVASGIQKNINHYFLYNGRAIVHLLDTIILQFPLWIWSIINSLMLTGICYLPSKIIASNNKKRQSLLTIIMFILISAIDIEISHQSLYWITASFNYVYPTFMFLAYLNSLTKINNSKKNYIYSLILGFLASATMEQTAMMTFGLTILTLLSKANSIKDIFNKQFYKTNIKYVWLCIITLIGACTILFAPGTFIRVDNASSKVSLPQILASRIPFLIKTYTRTFIALLTSILFSYFSINYINKNEPNKRTLADIKILLILNPILIIIQMCMITTTINILKLIITILIFTIYAITLLYLNCKIYGRKLITPLITLIVLFCGLQFMLSLSPIISSRNTLFGFVILDIIICIIASKAPITNYDNILKIFLCVFAITINLIHSTKYYENKQIYKENISIISNSQEIVNNENAELILHKFPNEDYVWIYFEDGKLWHLKQFKEYFEIKCNVFFD